MLFLACGVKRRPAIASLVLYQAKFFIILAVYIKECNKFARPISALLRRWATQLLLKKCRSGGKLWVTLRPI